MHCVAGWTWMAAGFLILADLMITFGTVQLLGAAALVSLAVPAVYGLRLSGK